MRQHRKRNNSIIPSNKNVTPIKIQKYNDFLKKMDEKQQKQELYNVQEPISEVKNSIDSILHEILEQYETNFLSSSHFSGFLNQDNENNQDPNKYQEGYLFDPTLETGKNTRKSILNKKIFDKSPSPPPVAPPPPPKRRIIIQKDVKKINDLIQITEEFPYDEAFDYNINLKALHTIQPCLVALNNMIGMKQLKENIVFQILYFIQHLHVSGGVGSSGDFMHTVIYGPPGTGKTEIAKLMGKMYSQLGILEKGVFKKVTRSDLVAGYLGQTAIKTMDVVKECLGGVLFIDEAYALGNKEKKDSFSKECIDTLCEALSDHKEKLMVIIAGYETELNECFFSYNQGLHSRFIWRFKTDQYTGEDLYHIFIKKIKEIGWALDEEDPDVSKISAKWFESKLHYFTYFGRDIETMISKVKIIHGQRIFGMGEEKKRKITLQDLEKGCELFLENGEVEKRMQEKHTQKIISTMYI
jgi:hypothetical protein